MMSRLVFKLGASGIAILVIGVALALWIGARTSAHLLAFTLAVQSDGNQYIYVTHLERGLSIPATLLPSNDFILRISPDGEWLLYIPLIEPDDRFALVNLNTWENRLLPEMPGRPMHYAAQWDDDHINLTEYSTDGTVAYSIYDIPTDQFTEVEALASLPVTLRNQVIVGSVIATDEDGEPTQAVTLDEDNIPRLYDYATSEGRLVRFEIGRDLPPVSIAPAYDFLAAVLTRNQQVDMFLIPAWEGDMTQLTNDNLYERNIAWSPDGRYLSYTVDITSLVPRRYYTEIRVYDVEAREVAYTISFERDRIMNAVPAWIP